MAALAHLHFDFCSLNILIFFVLEPLSKQSEVKKNDHKSSASASKGAHLVLESGCAVELGKPPDTQYGVIRWMRSIKGVDQAYVEMVNQIDVYTTVCMYVHTHVCTYVAMYVMYACTVCMYVYYIYVGRW